MDRIKFISASSLIRNSCSLNRCNSIYHLIKCINTRINIAHSLDITFTDRHLILSYQKTTNSINTFIHNIFHSQGLNIGIGTFSKRWIQQAVNRRGQSHWQIMVDDSLTVTASCGSSSTIHHSMNHFKIFLFCKFPYGRIYWFTGKHAINRNRDQLNPTNIGANRQTVNLLPEKAPIFFLLSRTCLSHHLQEHFPRQMTQIIFFVFLKNNL